MSIAEATAPPRAKPKNGAVVPMVGPSEGNAFLAIIDKAAANPNTNVETMERLLGIYERVEASQARQDFADALVQCQREMPEVVKRGINPHTKSKYATLEAISEVIDPVINRHGFALSYGTADSPMPDHYRIICKVMRGRHTETYQADVPADLAGAKGTSNKNPTQGFGSTMSYGRRYLKVMIFDIKIVGEDDDGNHTQRNDNLINASEISWLRREIVELNVDIPGYLKFMGVAKLEDITVDRMPMARHALKQKRIARDNAQAALAKPAAATEAQPATAKPKAVK